MHNLTVIYRITDIPSTNPSPIYQDNKVALNKLCLKSFVEAYKDVEPEVIFLCDHVKDGDYIDVPFKHKKLASMAGINETMLKSYELATKINGFVLFQECDYLYRPNIGRLFLSALDKLDIVSPYDHLNFYKDNELHSDSPELTLVNGKHFRTTERNTMTWGTHSDIIREFKELFDKYGYLDDQVWYDLLLAGLRLWVPIPSMATHCVADYLAPGVDWSTLWKKYQ